MLKFIEVKFTQRKISNFKVNTSAAFSTFTMLRNCHLDLVPNRLHHPKMKPRATTRPLPTRSSAPGSHSSLRWGTVSLAASGQRSARRTECRCNVTPYRAHVHILLILPMLFFSAILLSLNQDPVQDTVLRQGVCSLCLFHLDRLLGPFKIYIFIIHNLIYYINLINIYLNLIDRYLIYIWYNEIAIIPIIYYMYINFSLWKSLRFTEKLQSTPSSLCPSPSLPGCIGHMTAVRISELKN